MAEEEAAPTAAERALRAGAAAYRTGRYGEAARLFARVVASDGTHAVAWGQLGSARWRRGDRDGAIEAWRRAVAEAPDSSRAWHNLATALLAAGDPAEAAKAAERSVALDPQRAKGWNNLGAARHACGDFGGAETALRRALEMEPGLAIARANLARSLFDQGRVVEAQTAFLRAMEEGQTDPDTRVAAARCLEARGLSGHAERLLAEGVKESPASVALWLALGDLRRSRGAHAPALDAYEAAAAAAADMAPTVRTTVGRRRALAALVVAREHVEDGDGPWFVAAAGRLRAAVVEGGAAVLDEPTIAAARDRCVAHAAAGRLDARWVAEVLSGAMRVPPAPGGTTGPTAP